MGTRVSQPIGIVAVRIVAVSVVALGVVVSGGLLAAADSAMHLETAAARPAADLRARRLDKIQGVTISTHRIGLEWGTEVIGPTLDHIRSIGANWVAIHPYASIGADGAVRFDRFDPAAYAESVRRPIREAHARGLKILVKPHLAYWGTGFSWRGEIDFEGPALARFFRDYRRWTVHLAELAADADAFSVGCELDRLVEHDREWRNIIDEVRSKTEAPLTYAANWPTYQTVPFWDALDAIGIQAYFPLSETESPTRAELEDAWKRLMTTLRAYSKAKDRTVVFTELGYNHSTQTARTPWDYGVENSAQAAALQRSCFEVALAAVDAEPSVVGSFLWKWFPEPHPNGSTYALATDAIKTLICERWCKKASDE